MTADQDLSRFPPFTTPEDIQSMADKIAYTLRGWTLNGEPVLDPLKHGVENLALGMAYMTREHWRNVWKSD